MTIKYFVILLILALSPYLISAQGLQMEPLIGSKGFYYHHIIGTQFGRNTKMGMLNISSASARYSGSIAPELMSQIYLTRQISQTFSFGAGMIYVTGVGMRPTAMGQVIITKKNLNLVFFPRVDLWKIPSMELMSVMEYRPEITSNFSFYSRIQLQTIWNKYQHLKSTQHLRLGLDTGDVQFGFAIMLEEYNMDFSTYQNYGIFIRKEIKHFPSRD